MGGEGNHYITLFLSWITSNINDYFSVPFFSIFIHLRQAINYTVDTKLWFIFVWEKVSLLPTLLRRWEGRYPGGIKFALCAGGEEVPAGWKGFFLAQGSQLPYIKHSSSN